MRTVHLTALVLLVLPLAGCTLPEATPPSAPAAPPSAAPVFIRTALLDGRWWFVQGSNRFLSLGVNAVVPRDWSTPPDGRVYNVVARYNADFDAWAEAVDQRLRGWNFNSAGAWSHEAIYQHTTLLHTRVLGLGAWGEEDARLLDVFSPAYAEDLDRTARTEVAPHAREERLIGYFINNELPWYGERGWPTTPKITLLTRYLRLSEASPGRHARCSSSSTGTPTTSPPSPATGRRPPLPSTGSRTRTMWSPAAAMRSRCRSPGPASSRNSTSG
jgi:hypothetical protein